MELIPIRALEPSVALSASCWWAFQLIFSVTIENLYTAIGLAGRSWKINRLAKKYFLILVNVRNFTSSVSTKVRFAFSVSLIHCGFDLNQNRLIELSQDWSLLSRTVIFSHLSAGFVKKEKKVLCTYAYFVFSRIVLDSRFGFCTFVWIYPRDGPGHPCRNPGGDRTHVRRMHKIQHERQSQVPVLTANLRIKKWRYYEAKVTSR